MVPNLVWIILALFVGVSVSSEDDAILAMEGKAFIEFTELEYEDYCRDIAEAEWSFINSPLNQSVLSIWQEIQNTYNTFKQKQREEVRNMSRDSIKNPSLLYKYDLIMKAGDALLEPEDWNKLISFIGANKQLRASATYSTKTGKLFRKDVENLLSHSGKSENKLASWSGWHHQLDPLISNFSSTLRLVEKAAKINEMKDVEEYWETLSGFPDGYNKMKMQWSNINRLHGKIVQFARSHLSHNYNINLNESLPAYLLGSLQGNDWTAMSIDTMPYTNLTYSIRKDLWKKKFIGRSLYGTASALGTELFDQKPQAKFWNNSLFNRQCPPKLINFCREGEMRVSTCFDATISNFLSAHKNVGKVLLYQMTVENTPILNIANRYSGLEEGISELFGIFSASPAWLNEISLLKKGDKNEEDKEIISLMITALDVFPRLAYYVAADMWRLNAIENSVTESEELVSSWWKYRQEYEKVTSNSMNEPTFLNDDYIVSNKPYLPKFIGTLLGFQLYEYLMESTEVRNDRVKNKPIDSNFIKMIQKGGADDWMEVLEKNLEIDDISVDPLLSFFRPLEDFLEEYQEATDYKTNSAEQKDLESIEKEIIHEINNPTTTAAPTTTVKQIINKKATPKDKTDTDIISKTGKRLKPDSSVQADKPADKPADASTTALPNLEKVPSESPVTHRALDEEYEDEKKPKINTSKAVWAVASVLVAIIIICVIAIFGRRRCRKTPKNRRYV